MNELNSNLADFRKSIDFIDKAFMFIIAERVRLMMKSIALKLKLNIPLSFTKKRKIILKKTITLAVEHHLNQLFIENLFQRIIQQGQLMSQQNQLINDKTSSATDINLYDVSIKDLQESIYHLDVALCGLLAERFHLVKKIGFLKKNQNLKALAETRWTEILSNKMKMAESLDIDSNFIKDIYELIHQESLKIENQIINNDEDIHSQ